MREIAEKHLPILLAACGLREGDELPPKVVEKFWDYKRIRDRCEMSDLSTHEYYLICFLAGEATPKPTDNKPKGILAMAIDGDLKVGDPIEVKWRSDWISATFQEVSVRKEIGFLPEGETDASEMKYVKPDRVRLPELVSA